jgi:hypothetical protein
METIERIAVDAAGSLDAFHHPYAYGVGLVAQGSAGP